MSKKDKYAKKVGKLVRRRTSGIELVVCTDKRKEGCAERGAKQVLKALKHELARLGVGEERVCLRACDHFGPCEYGPNIVVSPTGTWHTNVTPDDVPGILRALLAGEPVAHLLVESAPA